MELDTVAVIVFLVLIAPTGFLASIFAPAQSFLFATLWLSFLFMFTVIVMEVGLLVPVRRGGTRPSRWTIIVAVVDPTVFGTWALAAFVVNLIPLALLLKGLVWAAYVIVAMFVWVRWMDKMERLHPGGRRRLSARLQRKLGIKTR